MLRGQILTRKCSGVSLKVVINIKTQVKYRFSQKIVKYCNKVLLFCYITPLAAGSYVSIVLKHEI